MLSFRQLQLYRRVTKKFLKPIHIDKIYFSLTLHKLVHSNVINNLSHILHRPNQNFQKCWIRVVYQMFLNCIVSVHLPLSQITYHWHCVMELCRCQPLPSTDKACATPHRPNKRTHRWQLCVECLAIALDSSPSIYLLLSYRKKRFFANAALGSMTMAW